MNDSTCVVWSRGGDIKSGGARSSQIVRVPIRFSPHRRRWHYQLPSDRIRLAFPTDHCDRRHWSSVVAVVIVAVEDAAAMKEKRSNRYLDTRENSKVSEESREVMSWSTSDACNSPAQFDRCACCLRRFVRISFSIPLERSSIEHLIHVQYHWQANLCEKRMSRWTNIINEHRSYRGLVFLPSHSFPSYQWHTCLRTLYFWPFVCTEEKVRW